MGGECGRCFQFLWKHRHSWDWVHPGYCIYAKSAKQMWVILSMCEVILHTKHTINERSLWGVFSMLIYFCNRYVIYISTQCVCYNNNSDHCCNMNWLLVVLYNKHCPPLLPFYKPCLYQISLLSAPYLALIPARTLEILNYNCLICVFLLLSSHSHTQFYNNVSILCYCIISPNLSKSNLQLPLKHSPLIITSYYWATHP